MEAESGELSGHLLSLSSDVVLEILEHLYCHLGLASLSGVCWQLRRILPDEVVERRIRALCAMRGWCASYYDPTVAPVARLLTAPGEYAQALIPGPRGWKASKRFGYRLGYASRVRWLPAPHSAWPLNCGRTFLVGCGVVCQYATIRAALEAADDGDTLMLASGEFDEGSHPLEIAKSIRIVGAERGTRNDAACSADATRPSASIVRAQIIASGGCGAICGLTLVYPAGAAQPIVPQLPNAAAAEEADGETTHRCFAVTRSAVWALEDCIVSGGGVRVGSTAELAVIGCAVRGSETTGVLAQGNARLLVRCTEVAGHARSGMTVQHGARLWLQHSCVHGNALAGVKLMSRAPCVLSCSSVHSNGHIGVLLRDRAQASILGCELAVNGNAAGVACIQHSRLRLCGSDLRGNEGHGLICQHSARCSVETTLVRRNGGIGLMAAQEASVALACTTCECNGGRGLRADSRSRLELLGSANRLHGNSTTTSAAAAAVTSPASAAATSTAAVTSTAAAAVAAGETDADDDDEDGVEGGAADEWSWPVEAPVSQLRPRAASSRSAPPATNAATDLLQRALTEAGISEISMVRDSSHWEDEAQYGQEEEVTEERHVGPCGEFARRESRATKLGQWHPATLQMAWFMGAERPGSSASCASGSGGAAAPFTSPGWSEAMAALREEVAASLALQPPPFGGMQ